MTRGMDATTVPRFAVVGHPVAHSLSPSIHAAFARQTGVAVDYARLLAPRDGFASTADRFFADGGRGLNVTLPFKRAAFAACARTSGRARRAGAVNWLVREADGLVGDNTDGVGLVRDLERLLGASALDGRSVLLVGAGGAARGVVGALLDARVGRLVVTARDPTAAAALVDDAALESRGALAARALDAFDGERFDVIVNATSASLADTSLALPPATFRDASLAYDLVYAARPTRFLDDAREAGAARVADGLGMLVEQAAESFRLWLGPMPDTAPVLRELRDAMTPC